MLLNEFFSKRTYFYVKQHQYLSLKCKIQIDVKQDSQTHQTNNPWTQKKT